MVTTPLPCLVGGVKAFRLKRTVGDEDWYAAMRSLEASATANLARLHELEKLHRAAQHAIVAEYRPGHLRGSRPSSITGHCSRLSRWRSCSA